MILAVQRVNGCLGFIVLLLPVMQVIPITDSIAANKYSYLPAIALLLTLGWLVSRLWQDSSLTRRTAIIIVVIADLSRI